MGLQGARDSIQSSGFYAPLLSSAPAGFADMVFLRDTRKTLPPHPADGQGAYLLILSPENGNQYACHFACNGDVNDTV
jgi:hypothetical protein